MRCIVYKPLSLPCTSIQQLVSVQLTHASVLSSQHLLLLLLLQVDGNVLLHVWCPTQPTPYPSAPPLLAVSCTQLQPAVLLQLTHKLCIAAEGLVGDPMVHELAVQLGEELEQVTARHSTTAYPPPYDKPVSAAVAAGVRKSESAGESEGVSKNESEGVESEDGYTAEAQQHAAAAEALLKDSASDNSSTISSSSAGVSARSVSSSSSRGPRRRGGRQLSPQQQEAESRRLADYFKALQVSNSDWVTVGLA